MRDRASVTVTAIFMLLMAALIVFLGIKAKSVWVGVLAFVGMLAILYSLGTARSHQYGGFWIGMIVGLGAMAAAVWLSHLAGRFWWTPLFIFISLMFLSNGFSLKSEYEQPAGTVSIIFGILFFAFAIVGPWFLYGPLTGAAPVATHPIVAPTTAALAPTAVPKPVAPPVVRGSFFPGLWAFLIGVIKSGWGIFYLLLVILLGRIWLGKWGWLIAPIALLLAAGWLAWSKPGGAEPLTAFFTTRPLDHITSLLGWSERRLGSAAWGSLFTGAGIVAVLFPAYLTMYSANRAMVRAQQVRQLFGTTFAANLLQRSNAYTPYTSLVSVVAVAATIYGFVVMWKALAAFSAASGAPAFPLLGIADISQPRWKPVMQWPYFLNAGIYAVISLILTALQRRFGLALVAVNWFLNILGAALLGLFVPAGVISFLTGQSLALGVVTPLSLLKKTALPAPPPQPKPVFDQGQFMEELQRRIAERERERQLAEQEAEEGYTPTPIPPPTPTPREEPPIVVGGKYLAEEEEEEEELEGEVVYEHSENILDLIVDSQERMIFMDLYGDVFQCETYGGTTKLIDVNMQDPLGLAAVSGERIAAVDQAGEVFFSSGAPESITTSEEICAFTVNSFGSILAYTAKDSTCVRGLILAAGKDQVFIDCGELLTDIDFSSDNRYVAIGSGGGKIFIFDMAKRQINQTLTSTGLAGVSHLRSTPQGGWVAAYENSKLAAWDSEGRLLEKTSTGSPATCLAVDPKNGNIAYGNSSGEITIMDADFNTLLNASLHESDIVSAVFETSGNSLVTAGSDGIIRRIEF